MMSSNGNIFRVACHLCGEFTSHRWIPRTKASDAELWCFLWSTPEWTVDINNCVAGNLRRHRAYYDVTVMLQGFGTTLLSGSPLVESNEHICKSKVTNARIKKLSLINNTAVDCTYLHIHYNGVTWALMRFKSPTRLFVQQLVEANDKNIQAPHYWPFM